MTAGTRLRHRLRWWVTRREHKRLCRCCRGNGGLSQPPPQRGRKRKATAAASASATAAAVNAKPKGVGQRRHGLGAGDEKKVRAARLQARAAAGAGALDTASQAERARTVREPLGETMLVWNTNRLEAAAGGKLDKADWEQTEGGDGLSLLQASWRKLDWLEERLTERRPLVVVLQEVTGTRRQLRRGLRKWLADRGFASEVLPGEGRGAGDTVGRVNGQVVAVDAQRARIEGPAKQRRLERLDVRVAAVQVRRKGEADATPFGVVAMYGLHPGDAERVDEQGRRGACFERQLERAERWLDLQGGGVLVGDLNRVPHADWRAGRHVLNTGDKALKDFVEGSGGTPTELLGEARDEDGHVRMTHFTTGCATDTGLSRIDLAVARGRG